MIEKDVVIDGNYKSILKSISYYHSDHYTDCSELYLGREWDLVVGLDGLSPSTNRDVKNVKYNTYKFNYFLET